MVQPWIMWYKAQEQGRIRPDDHNLWEYLKEKGPAIFTLMAREWQYRRDAMPVDKFTPGDAPAIVEVVHLILSSLDGGDYKSLCVILLLLMSVRLSPTTVT